MGKSRKGDGVGDDISPILQQNEKELRFGADQGMRISTEPVFSKPNGRIIGELGNYFKNSIEERIKVDSCEQSLWFSFFFDGTGNNMDADSGTLKHSNVAKLFRAHEKDNINTGKYRIYIPGVGTYFKEISDKGGGMLGGSSGDMGERRIKWAFQEFDLRIKKHIARAGNLNNAILEVNISVFGFSRGAALARAFINRFVKKSCRQDRDGIWRLVQGGCKIRIRFMGLFDTVASVGLAMSANTTNVIGALINSHKLIINKRLENATLRASWLAYGSNGERDKGIGTDPAPGSFNGHPAWGGDMFIPHMVEEVRHFVAAHEIRNSFPLDSISVLNGGVINKPVNFFETVYPGVHSDVGGSYRPGEGGRSEISKLKLGLIPLIDMYGFALKKGIPLLPETAWKAENRKDFELGDDLFKVYSYYISKVSKSSILGIIVNSHMGLYYSWRFSCIRRKERGWHSESTRITKNEKVFSSEKIMLDEEIKRLKLLDRVAREEVQVHLQNRRPNLGLFSQISLENEKQKLVKNEEKLAQAIQRQRVTQDELLRAEARLYALPKTAALNNMIDLYDKQLLLDAQAIYRLYSHPFHGRKTTREGLRPHYKAMMDAYENEYIRDKGLKDELIIDFFDNYVHDSLAGFAKDATLLSDPRVIYIGADEKYQYAQSVEPAHGEAAAPDERRIA